MDKQVSTSGIPPLRKRLEIEINGIVDVTAQQIVTDCRDHRGARYFIHKPISVDTHTWLLNLFYKS